MRENGGTWEFHDLKPSNRIRVLFTATVLAVAAVPVWAETLTGRVVGVTDGDTVKVLTAEKVEERVRLSGVDAPEKAQPFGQVSKMHLSDQVFGQTVTVEWDKRDRYRRIVGRVMVGGVDANLGQITAGLAWHYKKYEDEQPAAERQVYAEAEVRARSAGVGLWRDRHPTPPWDWRKQKRGD